MNEWAIIMTKLLITLEVACDFLNLRDLIPIILGLVYNTRMSREDQIDLMLASVGAAICESTASGLPN